MCALNDEVRIRFPVQPVDRLGRFDSVVRLAAVPCLVRCKSSRTLKTWTPFTNLCPEGGVLGIRVLGWGVG